MVDTVGIEPTLTDPAADIDLPLSARQHAYRCIMYPKDGGCGGTRTPTDISPVASKTTACYQFRHAPIN